MKTLEYKVVELSTVTDRDIEEAINSVVKDVRLRRKTLQRGLQWRF